MRRVISKLQQVRSLPLACLDNLLIMCRQYSGHLSAGSRRAACRRGSEGGRESCYGIDAPNLESKFDIIFSEALQSDHS